MAQQRARRGVQRRRGRQEIDAQEASQASTLGVDLRAVEHSTARTLQIAQLRERAQAHGNAQLARELGGRPQLIQTRRPRRPSLDYVGGDAESAMALSSPTGDTLQAGESGYAVEMLRNAGDVAAEFEDQAEPLLLERVAAPSFSMLDRRLRELSRRKAEDAEEAENGWSLPSIREMYRSRSETLGNWVTDLTRQREQEMIKLNRYNGWTGVANGFVASLSRFDAMQKMLGIDNQEQFAAQMQAGLTDANDLAARAGAAFGNNGDHARLTAPDAADTVTGASQQVNQAAGVVSTAYTEFRTILNGQRIEALEAEGEPLRGRLRSIEEVRSFLRNVGGVVDTSMSVITKAPAHVANAATAISRTRAGFNAARNRRAVMRGGEASHDATYVTVNEAGDQIVRNLGTQTDTNMSSGEESAMPATGLSLPTGVADVIDKVSGLVYGEEIRRINLQLEALTTQIGAINQANEYDRLLAIQGRFRDAINDFAIKCTELQRVLGERRDEYLRLGQELDNFARRDAQARREGDAPGRGQERFATILTMVAGLRESLAVGRGAAAGFDSPEAFQDWLRTFAEERSRMATEIAPDEQESLLSIRRQLGQFHSNMALVEQMYGGIDSQAGELMALMHPGAAGTNTQGPGSEY